MTRIRAKESVRVSFGLSNSTNPPTIWVGMLRVSTGQYLFCGKKEDVFGTTAYARY